LVVELQAEFVGGLVMPALVAVKLMQDGSALMLLNLLILQDGVERSIDSIKIRSVGFLIKSIFEDIEAPVQAASEFRQFLVQDIS
jgi:uncharacterized membrane protein